MCGIAGWFSPETIPEEDHARLTDMVAALKHRGPDGQGTLVKKNVALGHARLAIIDLQNGSQPMTSAEGDAAIVFNGEIYNYRELRRKLLAEGCSFNTNSDTEVILQLYLRYGWRGFAALRGMFAFCLWDYRQQTGLLVRDFKGIKPLFLRVEKDAGITFASEAKAIAAREHESLQLNTNNLHLLLNFRYIPGNGTLIDNIEQLEPGCVLLWKMDGTIKKHRITPDIPASTTPLDALYDSINVHMTADVRVGAHLSGGLDSAAIVAIAKDKATCGLPTFTLNIGDDPNEARYARRTAELLGVENTQEADTPSDISEAHYQLIWHLEIPKVNAIQSSRLAKLVSRHVKVALSGLGSDELFLGYNAHRIFNVAERADHYIPRIASRSAGAFARHLGSLLPGPFWSEPERALLMTEALGNWPRVYGLLRSVWDDNKLREKIYGPRMLDTISHNAFDVIETYWPQQPDPVLAMAEFEWNQKMVNDLLWHEDRVSMAEGVETRVPYVDAGLAAQVQAIDRHLLMKNGQPKAYMKTMLRGLLPDEVIDRPKSGFQLDAPRYFVEHLSGMADRLLADSYVREIGLFNPEFVRTVRKFRAGKGLRWHYFMLYMMMMTHIWIEIFERRTWSPTK